MTPKTKRNNSACNNGGGTTTSRSRHDWKSRRHYVVFFLLAVGACAFLTTLSYYFESSVEEEEETTKPLLSSSSLSANEALKQYQLRAKKKRSGSFQIHGLVGAPYAQAETERSGGDNFKSYKPNNVKLTREEPVSTFSIDVDTASYSFVRRKLKEDRLPRVDEIRVEEIINYFDYEYPASENKHQPFEPVVAVSDSPWAKGRKLMHIGIKGYDNNNNNSNGDDKERRSSNLVFLIDVSGSMSGDDRLPLVKQSLELLLTALRPQDHVAIAAYADSAKVVLNSTPVYEKKKILKALRQLEAGGGTGGAGGLEMAYNLALANFDEGSVNRIILATDGDFNVGMTDETQLKEFIETKRKTGIFLSVLGFGMGNYQDSRMKTLANHGNGVASYIDTLNEAQKVLVDEAQSTIFPIAKDVKIQVEFNPAVVQEYRLIGYEKRLLEREDFNNDKVDAGDVGCGHTVTAIYEITPVGSNAEGAIQVDTLRYGDAAVASNTPEASRQAEEKEEATSLPGDAKGGGGSDHEYAFLKIRYKLPDEDTSQLIAKVISKSDEKMITMRNDRSASFFEGAAAAASANTNQTPSSAMISQEFGFAMAVASFAQLLQGSKHINEKEFTYDNVIAMAKANKGEDLYGYRTEFIQLVRKAKLLAKKMATTTKKGTDK